MEKTKFNLIITLFITVSPFYGASQKTIAVIDNHKYITNGDFGGKDHICQDDPFKWIHLATEIHVKFDSVVRIEVPIDSATRTELLKTAPYIHRYFYFLYNRRTKKLVEYYLSTEQQWKEK